MKICPVCNKEFKCITPQHIKTHDLSLESFKSMYPDICIGNGFLLKERSIINASHDGIMCMFCGKLITSIDRKQRKFCSKSCSAKYFNNFKKLPVKYCKLCGKEIEKKDQRYNKFCSRVCYDKYTQQMNDIRYQENVKNWIEGKIGGNNKSKCLSVKSFVKRFLFDTHGNKCEKCGWAEKNEFTGLIPLHVHHIDGDCSNTVPSNLQLLCPNCHSLTETFCSLNIGNSRREF